MSFYWDNARMVLNYLDFDRCEGIDGSDGACSWDAMASTTPQRLPDALHEAEQVLAWAHRAFGPPDAEDAELAQWDFDLQLAQETAARSTHDLVPHFDAATGRIKINSAQPEGGICVLTVTLSGSATFSEAFTAQFEWA